MCLPAFSKKEHISGELTFEQKLGFLLQPIRFRKTSRPQDNPFESDYFRVVTSAPFRRLQDKTQIFPLEERDFARRRLTHSIEVACIARQLANKIEQELVQMNLLHKECEFVEQHWMATIAETAGLVHDIGNPPYGHFGEDTIQAYFKELVTDGKDQNSTIILGKQSIVLKNGDTELTFSASRFLVNQLEGKNRIASAFSHLTKQQQNDLLNFDGNVQGFRILCQLGLSADDNSFNLSFPVLASVIKYPHSSVYKGSDIQENLKNRHDAEKIGYYESELRRYENICEKLHLRKNYRHPIAYILEAADDIVNVTSDVEDGFKMGVIPITMIQKIAEANELGDQTIFNELTKVTIQTYIDNQSKDCYNPRYRDRKTTNDLWVKEFRIRAINKLVEEAVAQFVNYHHAELIVNEAYDDGNKTNYDNDILGAELLAKSELRKRLSVLQKKTYNANNVIQSELLGEHVITELLDMFLSAMFSDDVIKKDKQTNRDIINTKTKAGKIYSLISENYRRAVCTKDEVIPADPYLKFQLAVDYVAGMTDSYALDLYNQLTNSK